MKTYYIIILFFIFSINGFAQEYDSIAEIKRLIIDTSFFFHSYQDHYIIEEGYKCDSSFYHDTVYSYQLNIESKILWKNDYNITINYKYDSKNRLIEETRYFGNSKRTLLQNIIKSFYYYNDHDSVELSRSYWTHRKSALSYRDSIFIPEDSINSKDWDHWSLLNIVKRQYDNKQRLIYMKSTSTVGDNEVSSYEYNKQGYLKKESSKLDQYLGDSVIYIKKKHIYYISNGNDSTVIDSQFFVDRFDVYNKEFIEKKDEAVYKTNMIISDSKKLIELKSNDTERYYRYDEKDRLLEEMDRFIYTNGDISERIFTYKYDQNDRVVERIEICKKCCFQEIKRKYYYKD